MAQDFFLVAEKLPGFEGFSHLAVAINPFVALAKVLEGFDHLGIKRSGASFSGGLVAVARFRQAHGFEGRI